MQNAINWFEIPAVNIDRAVKFYGTVLGKEIRRGEFGEMPHGFFPSDEDGVGGAIVLNPNYKPSDQGAVVYLNAGRDLDSIVSRVESAGGKLLMPKTAIGEQGFIAFLLDTEGNKVGLHAPA